MIPEWLPPELELTGNSFQADVSKLFSIYQQDFMVAPAPEVDSLPVYVNPHKDPAWSNSYPKGFTHIITRGEKIRMIDYDRAKRLPWVRAILDNYKQPEVKAFWDRHPKGDTLYLWLDEMDFVVILRRMRGKNRSASIIITAYTLTDGYNKREMKKRYDRSYRHL